ncbi:MAG: NAD(P)H-dependent oxidoreductase subunit E [Chitinophagaceae bacterium]|nr:NAD(P)H-dependent oxidoreductase subunit E [Chitinophagaceae bacterium]MCU0404289.1 NAD(P)H-dependent oxidoreductase subunit E [Chitinophagaceae bacterium]
MKSSVAGDWVTQHAKDPRVKLVAAKMKKENYRPDALIEILHTAQNAFGHLPLPILHFIGKGLKLPGSRVYSTVTFYHFFSLKSKGEHTCLVCTGTACYVKGAQAILNELEDKLGLKIGEVTKDNKLGVQAARCIGACGLAPAVVLDDEVHGKVLPADVLAMIHEKTNAHEQAGTE